MDAVRVMTFNIANAINTEDDGENAWEKRESLNVETIKHYAPDLIGFQQLDQGNLETYREQLADYQWALGEPTDEPELHAYNAIFWRPQRLDCLEAGSFYFSETPDQWSLGWDAAYVGALSWVRFRIIESGEMVLHLNTHLDHIGEQARQESIKLALQRLSELRQTTLPVIFTGDFNCNPWSPGYRIHVETTFTDECYHLLRAAGFVDTFLATGGEDSEAAFTFHGFEGDRYWAARHHMAGRIDWILTMDGRQRLRTQRYILARDQEPPVYPSDHYPVIADLVIES